MQVIYKYDLTLAGYQELTLPRNARILTADLQDCELKLWAIVDSENPARKIGIHILGTGSIVPEIERGFLKHLNTIQQEGFVWHIFEEMR